MLATAITYSCGQLKKSDDEKKDEETSHSAEEREATVGMYKSDAKALADAGADYFVVDTDHDICLIRKDKTRAYRDCKGNLSDARYSFDGTNIKSGDVKGKKISESEVPEEHKLVFNLIAVAKEINTELKKEKMSVSIRFAGSYMEFKPKQLELLKALKPETTALKDFLKSISADTLEVSDYTNTRFFLKDKAFGVASSIEIDVEKVVKSIKDKTIEFDRY